MCDRGERAAFLRAVAANPDDDLPRLVFADFLDESGRATDRARGLFIRGQIALERLDLESPAYPWAYFDLFARVCAAARGHVREWLKELPPAAALALKADRPGAHLFRRGFVEHLRIHPKAFVRSAADLFAVAPVTSAHFELDADSAGPLFACPELLRLRAVRLTRRTARPRAWGIAAVARCPHLANLRELDLSGCGLEDRDAQMLSRAEGLAALDTLKLHDNRLTYAGVVALAQSINLGHVRRIDLGGNGRLDGWRGELKRWYGSRLVF